MQHDMSLRDLRPANGSQPASHPDSPPPSTLSPVALADLRARVSPLIAEHRDRPGALLPLLHAIQDTVGHVPDDCVPWLAEALNLSRAEVHGVITFYHHFRRRPAGRHVVQICRAEACQACGADALVEQAQSMLGCAMHDTRADGAVTLEPVYCLGLCASGPAMQIDGRLHARVTARRLRTLVDTMKDVQA